MLRAYKYRIYPTPEQEVLFAKTFGCVRVVYNWALDIKSNLYKENKEMTYEKYKNMSYASRCKFIKKFLGITGYSRQDIVNYCFDKGGLSVKLSRSDELKIALYGDIIETVDNMFRKFEMIEKANEQCKRKKK